MFFLEAWPWSFPGETSFPLWHACERATGVQGRGDDHNRNVTWLCLSPEWRHLSQTWPSSCSHDPDEVERRDSPHHPSFPAERQGTLFFLARKSRVCPPQHLVHARASAEHRQPPASPLWRGGRPSLGHPGQGRWGRGGRGVGASEPRSRANTEEKGKGNDLVKQLEDKRCMGSPTCGTKQVDTQPHSETVSFPGEQTHGCQRGKGGGEARKRLGCQRQPEGVTAMRRTDSPGTVVNGMQSLAQRRTVAKPGVVIASLGVSMFKNYAVCLELM